MENNNIATKIQKLLNLSNNNPSSEEAQAALLKAQQLMAEHNITMEEASVESKPQMAKEFVEGGQSCYWKRLLAKLIADNFRCYTAISRGYGICFIGKKEEIQIAVQLFNYTSSVLERNMQKLRAKYRKQGLSTEGISGDYFDGFYNGLKAKFEEQVNKNNWGLILVKDKAVTEYFNSVTKKSKIGSRRVQARSYNHSIYTQGYNDGKATTTQKCLD